jgi:transcriptional regulator with XRE-family HTH domain
MRKTQKGFAVLIGAQRVSVSRYESGSVEPGAPVLWKLYHLAEKDEKEAIEQALKFRLGADLTGQNVLVDATLGDLEQMVNFEGRLDAIHSFNPNKRKDFARFISEVSTLLETCESIDSSLIEIVKLWRNHSVDPHARDLFRQAASYLRVGLHQADGEDEHASVKTNARPGDLLE